MQHVGSIARARACIPLTKRSAWLPHVKAGSKYSPTKKLDEKRSSQIDARSTAKAGWRLIGWFSWLQRQEGRPGQLDCLVGRNRQGNTPRCWEHGYHNLYCSHNVEWQATQNCTTVSPHYLGASIRRNGAISLGTSDSDEFAQLFALHRTEVLRSEVTQYLGSQPSNFACTIPR